MAAEDAAATDQGPAIGKSVPAKTSLGLFAGAIGGQGYLDDVGDNARFDNPIGVAADGAGNLYVTEGGDGTLRKVVLATGVVSTLIGTPRGRQTGVGSIDGVGANARFSYPGGLVAMDTDTLYVADSSNRTIRKVVIGTGEVTTGLVTTLAGVSEQRGVKLGPLPAKLNQPTALLALPNNLLIVADSAENALLQLN